MKDEICRFAGTGKFCKILIGVKCRGTDKLCRFCKTERQFQEERGRAILINRAKHNCNNCKYMGTPCRLSDEEEGEKDESEE